MYNLFYSLIYGQLFSNGDALVLEDIGFSLGIEDYTLNMSQYLSCLLATICTIIVYALCCLFVYKMVKLIGRLFVRL